MRDPADPFWQFDLGTSPPMLFALYLRDSAGLGGAGTPAVSPLTPAVQHADPRQLLHGVGGVTALRIEWEAWWRELVSDYYNAVVSVSLPDFPEFGSSPALQLITHAHYGAALSWAQERSAEHFELTRDRPGFGRRFLEDLVEEREMELGRRARPFTLKIVELPLSETRAWFVEPGKLIMSQDLHDDAAAYRSFVRPVVEILV